MRYMGILIFESSFVVLEIFDFDTGTYGPNLLPYPPPQTANSLARDKVDFSRSELQNTSFCASCGVVPVALPRVSISEPPQPCQN
jgi:hypothetical protein